MVGLSVILENYRGLSAKKTPRVISKGSMIKPPFSNSFSPTSSPPLSPGFLDCCFLCKQKLLPGKDIYMYKGDRAFCSEECRCRQIFTDEEESSSSTIAKKSCTSSSEYNCSLAAIKVVPPPQPYTTSSPSSSRSGKGPRNRPNAFAC